MGDYITSQRKEFEEANSLAGCIGGSGEAYPWHLKMDRKSRANNKIDHASTLRLQK